MTTAIVNNSLGNRGGFISAKIYSDMRGGCSCGGRYNKRIDNFGIELPICNSCGSTPEKYRITVNLIDESGKKVRSDVRYSQDGKRLTDIHAVSYFLRRINEQVINGDFDHRNYDSNSRRESLIFKNVSKAYLEYNEKRVQKGAIKACSLDKKKSIHKNHLVPFFGEFQINNITRSIVLRYVDEFQGGETAKADSIIELKTFFNHLKKYGEISNIPVIDSVKKKKKRSYIPSMDEINHILDFIEDEYYKEIFKFLTIYPIRPCELRCLRFKDFDFRNNKIVIRRHISGGKEIAGRKSADEFSPEGRLELPFDININDLTTRAMIKGQTDELVFPSKRAPDKIMHHSVLPRNWRKACEKAGVDYFDPYAIRHARATEIGRSSNGNVYTVKASLGHSNTKTSERYLDTVRVAQLGNVFQLTQ